LDIPGRYSERCPPDLRGCTSEPRGLGDSHVRERVARSVARHRLLHPAGTTPVLTPRDVVWHDPARHHRLCAPRRPDGDRALRSRLVPKVSLMKEEDLVKTRGAPVLEAINVGKSFGDNHVLADVSFSATKGEFVCIVGPSGTGKTTLLRALSALGPADRGEVRVDGRVITSPPPEVSVVFQDYSRS